MTTEQTTPLQGYVVLDLATMVAAPYCASILGEFGADVIKVEMPGRGDLLRLFGPVSGTGSSFNWLSEGRNKKSITLDLRKPEGAALARRMIERADVVTENFRPGTLEKWGLGYDALKVVKSDLVLVSVSAYGQFGPHKDRPGYARIAHGFSGLAHLSGEPDRAPVVPGASALGDYVAGVYAALGTMLALTARDRFGIGQQVDVSLYEGMFRMLDDLVPVYAKYGIVRDRLGPDSTSAVPHSNYKTKDGRWVSIACSNDRMFARLASAMGRLDLLEPGCFARVSDRIAHRDEVNRIVGDWVATWTSDEVVQRCLAADVPIGPINTIADIFEDEHVRERGNLVSVDAPGEGPVVVPNVVPRLTETPGRVNSLGPTLGQHNEEIYCEWLGLSTREFEDLRAREII
ncbi:MAG: CoA transferase [Pseudomonadota bacterium]|nr:CoA transferase [Pseudomonadota bacterium]